MNEFVQLYRALDQTMSTLDKIRILKTYFSDLPDEKDGAWTLYFLIERKLKRAVSSTLLSQWTMEIAQISE